MKKTNMDLQTHKQKLLKENPEFKREYYSYDLAFEIGQMLLEARSRLNKIIEILKIKITGKKRGGK